MYEMKKTILLILFTVVFCSALIAGDIPFFKSLFIGDEEYVRQEILKCKDVEKVEVVPRNKYNGDDLYKIHVYLTGDRFITFGDVTLYKYLSGSSDLYMLISQINDIVPIERALIPARINCIHNTAQYDFDLQLFHTRHIIQALSELKMNNILDIINNFDAVYSYISSLPEASEVYPWFIHFEEDVPYTETFIIPEEFIDGVPFSITEYEKEHDFFNKDLEITWEYRYKFYKMPVERAIKEYGLSFLRTDYKSN